MSRRARARTSVFGFAFVLLLVPIWWRLRSPVLPPSPQGPSSPHAANLDVTLIRSGLDPRALAASGVPTLAVSAIIQGASQHSLSHSNEVVAADTACATAAAEVERLESKIQSGHGTQLDIASYPIQVSALAQARSQREAALNSVFDASTQPLASGAKHTLSQIRGNRGWNLPLEFLVVDRSEAEWVRLRDSLAHERIALGKGLPVDPTVQAQLALWRSNPAVAAAAVSFDTNLATITAAWNSATH